MAIIQMSLLNRILICENRFRHRGVHDVCTTEIRPGRTWTSARSELWANSNYFVDLSLVNQSQELVCNCRIFVTLFRIFQYICADCIYFNNRLNFTWALTRQLKDMPSIFIV